MNLLDKIPFSVKSKQALQQARSRIGWAFVILFVTVFSLDTVFARPELGPPSIKLRTNLSQIVVAELESISDDHKLTITVSENLHNESEDSIIIRSDALTADRLVVGESYVIALVTWDVKRFPRVVKPRRDGAVIINLAGAMPAIFQPDADLVELLKWDLEASLESPDAILPLILRGMAQEDPQLQNFFATELVTRPQLHAKLTRKQRKTVASYMGDPDYFPSARELMLSDASFSNLLLSRRAKLSIARNIMITHPTYMEFGSPHGGLIRTAMKIMESSPKASDAIIAERWLTSNQPTLVESAASVIYAVNPDSLLAALKRAIEYTLLEKSSRDTLKNLLNRYELSLAGK